jgi:hypothetical protein
MESNDRVFSKMMQKSRLEMPYSDFEDNVMRRIEVESKFQRSISKSTQLSVLFFLLGTGFGLMINIFLSQSGTAFFGIYSDKIILFSQAAYILLVVTQLEKILRLTGKFR